MTREGAVFLDLKRDRYFRLSRAHSRGLEAAVHGWDSTPIAGEDCEPLSPEDAKQVAERLAGQGLLTRDSQSGWAPGTSSGNAITTVATAMRITESAAGAPVRASDVANFIFAFLGARAALKWRSLEAVVRGVERRKAQLGSRHEPIDEQQLARLVAIFRRLRSYTFTSHSNCLLHSLALLNFLARYRIHPTWVIGVEPAPFSAHSWVQHGSAVLDATPEEVDTFTPILVV